MAVHIDEDGNFYFGASGTVDFDNITYVPDFSVTKDGVLTAKSGTIGGISLNATDIQANYSSGSTGFKIQSNGTAEFNGVILQFGKETGSGVPTDPSVERIKIGDAVVFNRDVSNTSSLVSTKSFLVLADGDEDNPSIAIDGQHATMGFFVDVPLSGISRMQITNGTDNVASWASNDSAFTVPDKLVLGGLLQAGGGVGSSGQVLQSTGSGVQWANASGSHADSDHTSFAASSHDHDSDYYSSSAGSFLASSLSSHTSQAHSLSLNSNVSNNDSGGLFVTAVSGLGITRTNIAGTTMDTQKVRPHLSETYALGESGKKYTIGYFQFGTSSSDQRLKENIEDLDLGLDFINKLEPKKYNWTTETITLENGDEIVKREDIANMDMFGFLAQDVLAIDDLDDDTTYGIARHIVEEDTYEISNENFIAPLVKAVQELSTQISDLTARVEALEG
jgi:hypothetical protein